MSEVIQATPGWIQIPPQDSSQAEKSRGVMEIAESYVIADLDTRYMADFELAQCKELQKKITASYRSIKDPINEAGKAVDRLYRPILDVVDGGVRLLASKILDFDRKLERDRAAVQEAAKRAAEEERKRIEEQAAAVADAAPEKAAALREAAMFVQSPVISTTVATEDRSTAPRDLWSAEVVNLKELCLAFLNDLVPAEAVSANMSYLNARARAEKASLAIPGVRSVKSQTLVAKRG